MADNTDEENLDTPTNTQSENSSDEIISTTDTETINLNQETENMEVHKHPHHVTHKKKWGEYLLEFLMLFLAVFLGFLAENIREHEVEKERGIGYIKSFYKDLKHDTASLTIMLNDYEKKVAKLNLISPCYDSLSSKLSCNSCLTDLYLNSQYQYLNSLTYEQRIAELALNTDRADVIIPATRIYLNAMKWSGARQLFVPKIGLADGIVKAMYQGSL